MQSEPQFALVAFPFLLSQMYIFDLDVGKDLGENQVKHKTCLFGNIATQITFGPVRQDSTHDIFALNIFLYLKKGSLLDV